MILHLRDLLNTRIRVLIFECILECNFRYIYFLCLWLVCYHVLLIYVGGHKFAGIVLVYPQGDWYGLITKKNTEDLLDCIINNKKLVKCWRGNESLSW